LVQKFIIFMFTQSFEITLNKDDVHESVHRDIIVELTKKIQLYELHSL